MKQGEEGYTSSCRSIVGAAKAIETGIRERFDPDLYIMGNPLVSVVAFSSRTLNIYEVADEMGTLGWHLNALQSPPAIHIACTLPTIDAVEHFLNDLEAALQSVKLKGGPEGTKAAGDTAALYGVAGSLPNKSVIKSLASGFIDTLYKV